MLPNKWNFEPNGRLSLNGRGPLLLVFFIEEIHRGTKALFVFLNING